MKSVVITAVIAAAGILLPMAKADDWNELTKVTFSGPVEVPGRVLPAGTYWFKLMDSESNRDIVQILNSDQNRSLAILLAIPDYRLQPTSKTVITFSERPSGAPPAVKAWFYPGDNYGQEFVYPKHRAMELAKANNQPVLSMPNNYESNTKVQTQSANEPKVMAMKKAPVMAQQPSGAEVQESQVVTIPQKFAQNNPPPQQTAQNTQNPPAQLPQTASNLPLIALLGILFTTAAVALRLGARRIE
jgi:hypothetical protein